MESPPEEETTTSPEQNHQPPKENAIEADAVCEKSKKSEKPETKIPEPEESSDKVQSSKDVIESNAVTEQTSEETKVQEVPESIAQANPTNENNSEVTKEVSNEAVTIKEATVDAVSEEVNANEISQVQEPTKEKQIDPIDEGANEIQENASDSSDRNIILPLEESYEEESTAVTNVDSATTTDESVPEEVPEPAVSESFQTEGSKENDAAVPETVVVIGEPVLNEATEPPALEVTMIVDEAAAINGMPVLHKEVLNEEEEGEHEINENSIIHPVVVFLPSPLNEPETIEIIREEATGPLPTETPKDDKEIVIPPHILGRNLENPMSEEHVRNGKVRKPRLGVKIPNRNLTSQIVSGKDIQDEVMERSRLRNAAADDPSGGDLFFAKKLTQRLAKKLTEKSAAVNKSIATTSSSPPDVKPFLNVSDKITDNSDLIALLEGDDDVDWTPTGSSKRLEKKTPEWERETALKQLRELPKHGKSSRIPLTKTIPASTSSKIIENKRDSAEEPTLDDNAEPKFSMGVVTKTYTRKRKSSNDIKLITSSILQSQKKLHADKDKPSPLSSPPHAPQSASKQSEKSPQKALENAKGSTPKIQKVKSSSDKKEMPTLKKESPIVNQAKASTPKVQKQHDEKNDKISPEKAHPHVVIAKTMSPVPAKTPETIVAVQLSPNTYISKSSRIVKKKKIWDPDEDNTPKYMKPPVTKSPKVIELSEKVSEKTLEKKIEKLVEKAAELSAHEKPAVLKPNNERATPKKPTLKKVIMKKKKPKRLTEVDRLLMDEGAVNLLYSVKNTEELQNVNKKKASKSTISLDRAQRELLNKTNEIKNALQINSTKDSPISLRKKESGIISPSKELAAAILQRKKSTGSAHSPPASPAFYNQHAEASRIIRRHSSSSFSSENAEADNGAEKASSKRSGEPQKKKMRGHPERHSSSMGVDKQLLSEEMAKNFNTAIPMESKYTQFDTFSVRTHDHFIQIILSPTGPLGKTMLTLQALMELTALLDILKGDNGCRAVLLSSSGAAFCQGIDYKELVSSNESECLNLAENYAKCIKDFLMAVSSFPKILVAGVHGHTIGLGVTMLTLFDMVLASDTATFSTPFAAIGCAAEGGVLLTLPRVMHSALASELFFASRKLTAGEAFRLGLVTRTLWPDKFQDELISSLKITSGQSLQALQAIKSQLRHHLSGNLVKALEEESSVLVQHWTSTECQSKFLNYNVESK